MISDHIKGKHIIGIYPLLEDNSCYFLAVDFDKKQWKEDVRAFVQTCKEWKIPFHIERSRSGEGAHVWFFFEKAIKATLARKFGLSLLEKTNEKRLEIGLDSFDRLFPNQDFLPRGGMGNLIALPFQNEARLKGNSVFVNEAFEEYEDQWAYLSSIKKLRDKEI